MNASTCISVFFLGGFLLGLSFLWAMIFFFLFLFAALFFLFAVQRGPFLVTENHSGRVTMPGTKVLHSTSSSP